MAQGNDHIVLGGHSIGANKVLLYLSEHRKAPVDRFIALSPINMDVMLNSVTDEERRIVQEYMDSGREYDMLPFSMMQWTNMVARTADEWLHYTPIANCHSEPMDSISDDDGGIEDSSDQLVGSSNHDYSVLEQVYVKGAFFIGGLDSFGAGQARAFLENNNRHMPYSADNDIVVIRGTGHTYQHKGGSVGARDFESVAEVV